jgi:hypothetical protein
MEDPISNLISIYLLLDQFVTGLYENFCTIISSRYLFRTKSRNGSVGIALCYGLDGRGSRARFRGGGAGNFSLHHRVQNGSGAHLVTYPMGTGCSFRGG